MKYTSGRVTVQDSAYLLLLVAAVCHAAWNLIAKRTVGSHHWIFTFAMLTGAIVLSLALFAAKLPAFCWLLAVLSAVMETVYYLLLAHAYDRYPLSFVYPVGRGSAPLFTTLVGKGMLGVGAVLSDVGEDRGEVGVVGAAEDDPRFVA